MKLFEFVIVSRIISLCGPSFLLGYIYIEGSSEAYYWFGFLNSSKHFGFILGRCLGICSIINSITILMSCDSVNDKLLLEFSINLYIALFLSFLFIIRNNTFYDKNFMWVISGPWVLCNQDKLELFTRYVCYKLIVSSL